MSRNGSGTYTLPAGNPVVTGTTITSSWANSTLSDIANSLTQSVSADGQTPVTGALNMTGHLINNVTDPVSAQDAATKIYVDTADTANLALSLLKANNLSDVANATTSRTNLVAAKSGANSDITSLTGLTTPLTVTQGGIGVATLTANNVLLGNGTSAPQVVAPSTSGNVLTSNGTTWTSVAGAYALTSGTAVASTSGTSIDFTGIPSWVKRVTLMFSNVSTTGTGNTLIQLGTGSTPTTTGYVNAIGSYVGTGSYGSTVSTSGFIILTDNASDLFSGNIVFCLENASTNTWICSYTLTRQQSGANYVSLGGGSISLSGSLGIVRTTTPAGTATFDSGSINILYE